MKLKNKAFIVTMTLMCLITTITNGCGNVSSDDNRTAEETEALDTTANAMTNLAPWAVESCERHMREAKDSLSYYDYMTVKAKSYLFTNTPESTLIYARHINDFLSKQPHTRRTNGMMARAVAAEASYFYLLKSDTRRVIDLNAKAFALAEKSDITQQLPDMAANLADAYVASNDLASASRWYRKALFLVDSLELPKEKNITLYLGLAQIYTDSRDFSSAKKYYELTDIQYDSMKPNMQTYFLNNYGNYLYFIHDYRAAHDMFMRMKRHLEKHDSSDTFDMYLCKINLADVMLNLGNTDSAHILVDEVEPYFKRHKVMPAIYYVNTIRLGIAAHKDDTPSAQRIINSGDDSIKVENAMKRIRNKYLRDYYIAKGDYRHAYKHLYEEQAMNDSLLSINQKYKASEIINQLTEDTLKLHHKLEMEEKNAEVQMSKVSVVLLLAVAIALVFAFSYFVARSRKQRLRMHIDLMQLRMANARQRISPHFVFNLLNADMAKVSQTEGERLLKISRLMRESLTLVHESYVTLKEELSFVNQYIELYRTLLGNNFTLEYSAPDSEALSKVTIPPMMVQILVENAIKHGLKNNEGDKVLTIRVNINDEKTIICVADNGPGFDVTHSCCDAQRSGLYIIRHTINYINNHNRGKNRMSFNIHNLERNDGSTCGCQAEIEIPRGIRFPEINSERNN